MYNDDTEDEETFVNLENPEECGLTVLDDGTQIVGGVDESDCEGDEDIADDSEMILKGHTKPVHCIALHPNLPGLLATGGEDDMVFLWDISSIDTPKQFALQAHEDTVLSVAFQPVSGSLLASSAMDGRVILWKDVRTANPCLGRVYKSLTGEVLWVLWHSSGQVIVAGCSDGQAALWSVDSESEDPLQYFTCGAAVNLGAWSTDEKKLILGSEDCSIRVFSPKSGECIYCSTGKEYPTALSIMNDSPDGLLCGLVSGAIVSISIAQKKIVNTLAEVHSQAIERICLHPSLNIMGCVSCDALVSIWNLDAMVLRYVVRCEDGVTKGMWVQNYFVVCTLDGTILTWDGREDFNNTQNHVLRGHLGAVLDMNLIGCGKLVSAGDDCTVRIFQLPHEKIED